MSEAGTLRYWQELEGSEALTLAEKELIAGYTKAQETITIQAVDSNQATLQSTVRADLLREVISLNLGPTHTRGWHQYAKTFTLEGASITGELNLDYTTLDRPIWLKNCSFDQPISLIDAQIPRLSLAGSWLSGLKAQGLTVRSHLVLRECHSSGEISLFGARIDGRLICENARLSNPEGYAFIAQDAEIEGNLTLKGSVFEGRVSVIGADIHGDLDCLGCTFSDTRGKAVQAQRLNLRGGMIWSKVTVEAGSVHLGSAHVSNLVDDVKSWPESGNFNLDGFTYERLSDTSMGLADRLDWLAKGSRWKGRFYAQPYTQLARFYAHIGKDADARKVLIARERKRHRYDAELMSPLSPVRWAKRLWAGASDVFTGFGFQSWRSLIAVFVITLIGAIPAHFTWETGDFAPNAAPVLISQGWQEVVAQDCYHRAPPVCIANPAATWASQGEAGMDWETFNALAYAADIVIPIIDIGQTSAWAPSTERGDWGQRLWWLRWVLTGLGWFFTVLGAAAVTGLIRRE